MRVIKEGPSTFYIEGIVNEGHFWVDLNTFRVDEEKTARLLGCIDNTLSTKEADKALWQWKLKEFTNKDF